MMSIKRRLREWLLPNKQLKEIEDEIDYLNSQLEYVESIVEEMYDER